MPDWCGWFFRVLVWLGCGEQVVLTYQNPFCSKGIGLLEAFFVRTFVEPKFTSTKCLGTHSFCSNHGVNGFCRAESKCTHLTNWFSIGLNFLYKKDFNLDGIQSDLLKNSYVCLTKRMWNSSMIPGMAIQTIGSYKKQVSKSMFCLQIWPSNWFVEHPGPPFL